MVPPQIQALPGIVVAWIFLPQMLDHQCSLSHPALAGNHVATPAKQTPSWKRSSVGSGKAPNHLAAQLKKGINHGLRYNFDASFNGMQSILFGPQSFQSRDPVPKIP